MTELGRIDWNLIPALDALLTERNVSRAARRLHVSQPAMSNALQRLRRHFQDDLLVRQGNTHLFTPLAERLAPLAREVVESGRRVVNSGASFDPRLDNRHFTIAATGAMQTVFGPELLADIRQLAPGVTVTFVAPFVEPFRTYEDVIAGTDGWLAPREMLPGHKRTGQISDSWVCIVAHDHPAVGDTLTLEDAERLPWVAPTIRGTPLRVHLDALAAHGIEPRVEVYSESFTSIPFHVSGTDRIGVMQRRLAKRLAPATGTRILKCPWPVQPLNITFWWDRRWETDPAHVWLRTVINRSMSRIDSV